MSAHNAPKIDNLYLDMNGIIHNCVRSSPGNGTVDSKRYSSSAPAPSKPQHEIFLDVFRYIDNLFALLPPRKLLYMAIDGVAPRAKMNQQRARRFRSAKERLDEHTQMMQQDPMYAAASVEPFDSNCITPGTHFMQALTIALKYFVEKKMAEDKDWASIQVVLSGAEAPGEGEHKIMEYIRAVRESGELLPNTRHCVYGLDADLIMLGLVTHEPHFFILREKVDYNSHWKKKSGPRVATSLDTIVFGEFELLSIGLFREYLALDLGADLNSTLPYFDIDRITDDFVFILMLIGNDFLPNLPTLDIADGTLNILLHLYKRVLPYLGGYLTETGKIHGDRLEYFLAKLATLEVEVLRAKKEEASKASSSRRGQRNGRGKVLANVDLDVLFQIRFDKQKPFLPHPFSPTQLKTETLACRAKMQQPNHTLLRNAYYTEKFGCDFIEDPTQLEDLTRNYLEGISWTLKYYTEGCRQWRWFYPYHYAPLASDITNAAATLTKYESQITRDIPFRPLEQLLSVLPPVSSWCLPKPYRTLMISPASPIHDHYPTNFETDMNGKRNDWEAVVLLPFVDEGRLQEAVKSVPLTSLSNDERVRNEFGPSLVYTYTGTPGEAVVSPFGTRMPSLISLTRRGELFLPALRDGQPFTTKAIPGTEQAGSSESYADLPTLLSVMHNGRLAGVGVNVFGTPSKSESMLLQMQFDSKCSSNDNVGKEKRSSSPVSVLDQKGINPGSPVWFGYPWRAAGVVDSISNQYITKRYVPMRGQYDPKVSAPRIEAKATNKSDFQRDVSAVIANLMQRGVSVVEPEHMPSTRREEPTIAKIKCDEKSVSLCHEGFVNRRAVDPSPSLNSGISATGLAPGQTVLYVGQGPYFGHKCTVLSVGIAGIAKVSFCCLAASAREPAFGYRVIADRTRRWMSWSKLISTVGVSKPAIEAFLASLRVRLPSSREEVDLGLGISYVRRGLYIPGYARKDDFHRFSFSDKCANVLQQYRAQFPDLFAAVEEAMREKARAASEGNKGQAVFDAHQIFKNARNPEEAVKAASTWVSVQDVAKHPLVSTRSEVLPTETVMELEKNHRVVVRLQSEYERFLKESHRTPSDTEVSIDALVSGREGVAWDGKMASGLRYGPVAVNGAGLRLGDRVVNRMGSGTVTFGLRGTVVGIHPNDETDDSPSKLDGDISNSTALVDVVFDENFISGGSLGGRCTDGRGKTVQANSLFIIRPDCENQYYIQNYAKVAAQVLKALNRAEAAQEDDDGKRTSAISRAAAQSYAQAAKKKVQRTQPNTVRGTGGAGKEDSSSNSLSMVGRDASNRNRNFSVKTSQLGAPVDFPRPHGAPVENLPIPKFISQKRGQRQHNAAYGTESTSRTRRANQGLPAVNGRDSESIGKDSTAARQLENQLREVLKLGGQDPLSKETEKGNGTDLYMSESSQPPDSTTKTAGKEEDELAVMWRELQQKSGNNNVS